MKKILNSKLIRKISKKLLSIMLVFVTVLVGTGIYIIFFQPKAASAAWFDDTWTYRQRVDITNSGSNQTDYQVMITLATSTLITASKMQSDCDDIRITDTSGRLLPHWVQKNPTAGACNQSTTKIWVKVPSITTTGAALFVYYGNPSAPNVESGARTFITFEDFSAYSTGTDITSVPGWTKDVDQSSTYTIDSNRLKMVHLGGAPDEARDGAMYSFTNEITSDTAIDTDVTTDNADSWDFMFSGGDSGYTPMSDSAGSIFFTAVNGGSESWNQHDGSIWNNIFEPLVNSQTYVMSVGMEFGADTDDFYLDNTFKGSFGSWDDTSTGLKKIAFGNYGYSSLSTTWYVDNIRTRKYATTEPAVASPTNEEKGTAPIAYWKFDEGKNQIASNAQYKSSGSVTNLHTNPSFETNVTNWLAVDNLPTTWAISNDRAAVGAYSGKMGFTGAFSVVGAKYQVSLTAGTTYVVSAWIYVVDGCSACNLQFDVVHPAAAAETDISNSVASTRGTWVRYSGSLTPAGSGTAEVRVFSDQTANLTAYIDGFQVEAASYASNYCDGSLVGNGTHSWSGTAHASTSVCSSGTDGNVSSAAWQSEDKCISGKCLYFDGSDDTVQVPTNPSLNITGDMTISTWIRSGADDLDSPILTKEYYTNGADNGGYGIWLLTDGRIQADFRNNTVNNLNSTGTVHDNKWHQIVAVYDDAGTIKIYIDGVLDSTDSSGVPSSLGTTTTPLLIGGLYRDAAYDFKGTVDEPKIYNFALSADQIKANYNSKASLDSTSSVLGTNNQNMPSALSNGLVGYWPMDEATGNTCTTGGTTDSCDKSGNGNNGTWNGDATAASGKFGNGTIYDGTGDSVQVSDANSLDVGDTLTISAWVKKTSNGSAQIITQKDTAFSLYFDSDNKLRFDEPGTATIFTSTATYTDASWHHVVATKDGSTTVVYVDGAVVAGTVNNQTLASNASAMGIGANSGGSGGYFIGTIDEMRLYNRALTASEVSQLYNWAPGPVLYHDLDKGSGTTIDDRSGSGLHGVAAGTPAWKSGKFGKALDFDGTDDKYTVNDSALLRPSEITVSYWMKLDSQAGFGTPLAKSTTGSWNDGYGFYNRGANSQFTWWVNAYNTGSQFVVITVPSLNTWHHISGTFDTTNGVKLYVDGVLVGTATGTTAISHATNTLDIGHHAGGHYIDGQIDDLKIYNYARSAKQVVEDMNASHPAPGSPVGSPLLHYKFDEGYGSSANNSGSAGSALAGSSADFPTWTQEGKFGKALTFNGTSDYVGITDPDSLDMATDSFTLTAWVKTTDDSGIIMSKYGSVGYDWRVEGGLKFALNDAGGGVESSAQGSTVADGNWHHAAVSVNRSGNAVQYLDGVQVGTLDVSARTATISNSEAFRVGVRSNFLGYLSGTLDEVKVYRAALTADQVKLDMNQGQAQVLGALSDNSTYQKQAANQEYCVPGDSTSCAAPVGRWDLDEGTGTSAYDKSGNGGTGTIGGSPSVTWVAGKIGKGLRVPEGSGGVTVTNSSYNNLTGDATYEAWIKPTATSYPDCATNFHWFSNETFQSNGIVIRLDGCTGYPYFRTSRASNFSHVYSDTKVQSHVWSHVVITKSGSTVSFYINGKKTGYSNGGGSTVENPVSTSNNFVIGGTGGSQSIAGEIDNVRVYNYARSASQVAWDYNKGKPVAHLKLDECQGTSAGDSSGLGNTGTINIGATGTYTSAGTCASGTSTHAWAGGAAGAGKRNYALSFDGTDDYINFASSFGIAPSVYTYSMWVNRSGTNDCIMSILSTSTINSGYHYCSFALDGSTLYAAIYTGAVTNTSLGTLTADTWYHIAQTYDGTTLKGYVNGVFVNSVAATYAGPGNAQYYGFAGTEGSSVGSATGYFAGKLDDIQIHWYPMTATQIKTIYNESAARYGPTSGAP